MDFPSTKFKDNAESSTGLLFIRVYNKWHSIITQELRKLGITHPQFVVLTTLNFLSQSDDNVTQVSISKMADMDVMSVSQIIKGLEKKEFIKRTSNPKDSRANSVILLAKGQEMVKTALPVVEKIDDEFFGVLQENERIFRDYLNQLD
ncbi:transcriptional regulator HosA [Clostridium saccharobutylicum]|uniref:Transcriptional regulator, MarR family n=1 Tax=Clostridium saccharobutylicum DSM 13864 TaxID=1345695 RepID=U5MUG3_CLOSA|nr:transcriptional regulator, MarR family [Clostridium saccharobutylicum DSM 13864]AQR91682.1 transcriptional regulator HosA [Clostridium saccharobutylicum]AQS01586.1 transcriptional regulator HosA [Clostridium saccharobutylicum]AQS11196.1 transcriptional regulator HosA [Clostridium saccharobutylicum]AQS15569.1 transcriptional regulator HosA [Clostridium saccharobutylicum]